MPSASYPVAPLSTMLSAFCPLSLAAGLPPPLLVAVGPRWVLKNGLAARQVDLNDIQVKLFASKEQQLMQFYC